tara:strand:+ start:3924 stop:4430 length:507 start_codon:yes stop_codon:yes gene_type:complete
MKKIAIISDTHNCIDSKITSIISDCDEIWHAGDFGYSNDIKKFIETHKVIGVYGNIDGAYIRSQYPKYKLFICEDFKILITHIGGRPNHYNHETREAIQLLKPDIFISGHSHILKIIHDKTHDLIYINPGAAGKEGFHQIRTIVLINLNNKKIVSMEVVELGKRSQLP